MGSELRSILIIMFSGLMDIEKKMGRITGYTHCEGIYGWSVIFIHHACPVTSLHSCKYLLFMIDSSILAGFLPWIAFALVSSVTSTRLAAFIGLALALILFLPRVLKKTYTSMDLFGVIFFVLLALASLAFNEGDLTRLKIWSGVLIYGSLSVFSWATILRGDPFTREYGRRMVPKEYWQSSLFLNSTKSIALGWSTAFLMATVVSLAGVLMGIGGLLIYSLGIGCMIIAILWHRRVLAVAEAEGKRLREAAQKNRAT